MYEFFEHTADVGIRVRTPTLEQLFAEAAEALMRYILDAPALGPDARPVSFQLAATDVEDLLHDWLSELLFTLETEHLVFGDFRVTPAESGTSLTAAARAEPLDPPRHRPSHEVKAVTYHALRVEQRADGWLAEVVLDI